MKGFYQWIGTMTATVCFLVTLYICVAGEQDLLMSVLKAIGVFFLIRIIANVLISLLEGLEQMKHPQSQTGHETTGEQ